MNPDFSDCPCKVRYIMIWHTEENNTFVETFAKSQDVEKKYTDYKNGNYRHLTLVDMYEVANRIDMVPTTTYRMA